uniref:Uncharacterized protein n=1 Tax=Ascaris lumbricoides TaxID=6252 RepID=A0A9J2P183_ASCLU
MLPQLVPTMPPTRRHTRSSTSSGLMKEFHSISFRITDIGGSAFCRRKWKNFYANTSLLIFVVDLAKFGKKSTTRMSTSLEEESVTVFSELSSNTILKRAHFMIVFNKRDALDEQQPQLNGAPPGGTEHEPTADRSASLSMIRSKFLNQVTSRKIYQHTVSLINRNNVESTITESINSIAKRNRIPSPT